MKNDIDHTRKMIISEIKRTAKENGGSPLGQVKFEEVTGIKRNEWYGKIWRKWSAANIEAGLEPNQFITKSFEKEWLLEKLIVLIRALNHFPAESDIVAQKSVDDEFPSESTLRNHLGKKLPMVQSVLNYCKNQDSYSDVQDICIPLVKSLKATTKSGDDSINHFTKESYVYLDKHGSEYKIGHSTDPKKRLKELQVQDPYPIKEIHRIRTDDPSGIETYWHNRFKDRMLEDELFKLTPSDVRIFKKRRSM